MVRAYRQPDERLSTQRPERLTRTFNYTRVGWDVRFLTRISFIID